nr:MAG TPA: hypothetical protein [Caudoviricetes sp.]
MLFRELNSQILHRISQLSAPASLHITPSIRFSFLIAYFFTFVLASSRFLLSLICQ